MKSFIYLDTDTVNSYIAQIDNGLKTLQTQTSQSSSSTEKQIKIIEHDNENQTILPAGERNPDPVVQHTGRHGQ